MFIEIKNTKINYMVSGEGKDLVLLHGWGGQIASFKPVHQYFEKYFRTYSIDLPGFGESGLPPRPWGSEDYADIISQMFSQLGINNPTLIGHSFGGKISIILASKLKVNKLILVDSAGIRRKKGPAYYFKVYSYKSAKKILSLPFLNSCCGKMLENYKSKLGSADYRNAQGVMQQTLVKVVNEDFRHLLPEIKASTLIFWGEKDTDTPLSDGQLMEKLIPDSGLVVFKNAAHFSYLDKLNDFLIISSNFLKNDMGR